MTIVCPGNLSTGLNGEALCDEPWEQGADVFADMLLLTQEFLATPPVEDLQIAFMAGCSLPLIAYLTAWGYQTVINFSTRN
jgi:hypothetical protein